MAVPGISNLKNVVLTPEQMIIRVSALLAAQRGDFESADALFQRTLENPNTVEALLTRARFYQEYDLVLPALRSFEQAHFLLVDQCQDMTCYYEGGGNQIRDAFLATPTMEHYFFYMKSHAARHFASK